MITLILHNLNFYYLFALYKHKTEFSFILHYTEQLHSRNDRDLYTTTTYNNNE